MVGRQKQPLAAKINTSNQNKNKEKREKKGMSDLASNSSGLCGFCGIEALVKCANCKTTHYCDRNCQKRHWKDHKKVCILVKQKPVEIKIVEPLDALDISNLTLKVQVAPKSNGQFGVFSTDFIKKGEKVCFYDGETKDANTKVRLRKLPESRYASYFFKIRKKIVELL